MLRRKLANPYTMSSLVSYEPFVDECSSILVQKLTKFALNGERVDLGKWFQYYAFDVIGQITVGRSIIAWKVWLTRQSSHVDLVSWSRG